jgi:hypothetical protein
MKASKILFGAVLISGAAVNAQEPAPTPTFEVGLSYLRLHVNSAYNNLQRARNGVSRYCEHNLNRAVGLVVKLCDFTETGTEIDEQLMPRFFVPPFNSRRAGLHPCAPFLFGLCAGM